MTPTTHAAVQTAAGTIEVRELPVPEPPRSGAILRVEACGICGTDVEIFDGHATEHLGISYPFIPGHEPVGVIEEIDDEAAARWGVSSGDRVAVEAVVPCGGCRACQSGTTTLCSGQALGYGFMPLAYDHGLWGGYAQHLVLHPRTRLHVANGVTSTRLAFTNALAAGVEWAGAAEVTLGDTVVIFGPGPRGVACAVAARARGAAKVIVTGLSRDRARLESALALGATDVVDAGETDVVTAVRELTGGEMADVVIDTTPYYTGAIGDAIQAARRGGRIVIAGLKGGRAADLDVDSVAMKALRLIGVRAAGTPSWRQAVALLADDRWAWDRLGSQPFALADAAEAIDVQAGRSGSALHVLIAP